MCTLWVRISTTTKGQCMPPYDFFSAAIELSVLVVKQMEIGPSAGLSFLRDLWAWCSFQHIRLKVYCCEVDMKGKIQPFPCSYSEANCLVPVVEKGADCFWNNIFAGQKIDLCCKKNPNFSTGTETEILCRSKGLIMLNTMCGIYCAVETLCFSDE